MIVKTKRRLIKMSEELTKIGILHEANAKGKVGDQIRYNYKIDNLFYSGFLDVTNLLEKKVKVTYYEKPNPKNAQFPYKNVKSIEETTEEVKEEVKEKVKSSTEVLSKDDYWKRRETRDIECQKKITNHGTLNSSIEILKLTIAEEDKKALTREGLLKTAKEMALDIKKWVNENV